MKRISLLVAVLLAAAVGSAEASSYMSPRYQVHFSPYAFNYHHTGLVYGGVDYSPYAFNYGSSGLVSENVRYTPYALSYHHSGLVADAWAVYAPGCFGYQLYYPGRCEYPECGVTQSPRTSSADSWCRKALVEQELAWGAARHETKMQQGRESRKTPEALRKDDAMQVIRGYLQNKNIQNYDISQLLKMDNKTLSVDFVLRDKNMVIKYVNKEAIEALENEPQYRQKRFEEYKSNWAKTCAGYERQGYSIYYTSGCNSQEMTAMLDLCPNLKAG